MAGCRQTHKAITMKEVNHKWGDAWDDELDACDAWPAWQDAWDAWPAWPAYDAAAKHRKRLR